MLFGDTPRFEMAPASGRATLDEGREVDGFANRMKKSPLFALGLIDEEFIRRKGLKEETREFLRRLNNGLTIDGPKASSLLVEMGVITKADFQSHALAPKGIHEETLIILLRPIRRDQRAIKLLAGAKILNAKTLWSKFLNSENFYNTALNQEKFDWEHLVRSGIVRVDQVDSPNDGFDTIESNQLKLDLLGTSHKVRVYPLNRKAHPLVQKLRGQEKTKKMSRQIKRVIGREGKSIMEDFEKVFNFYLKKSRFYREALKRDKIPAARRDRERAQNIKAVNTRQIEKIKADRRSNGDSWRGGEPGGEFFDPAKRHFDIYARYGHGQMDPLQLAFISKAAEWYIMGGRSRLFNSVRIVPYSNALHDPNMIPQVALAMCKGSELLKVSWSDFKDSIVGANRTFLTHSDSNEASDLHSVPIIGMTTRENSRKHSENEDDYVVFNGYFDPKDVSMFSLPRSKDVNGNIAGLIDETLRTMMEVEDKEIARAQA